MESTTQLRVRYVETDAMGIVHHASYVAWLELGRTELLRGLGQSYREWERAGVHLTVGEVHLKYRAPAYFDDLVDVRTLVAEAARRRVGFTYRIERGGVLLAEARTVHLATGADGRARVLPDEFLKLLGGGCRTQQP
ncbi:MAG: acyl-CoA thioesterase [Holophagaceae bacterium]|nr:acyl-CoA thioesterase [Holophagaceae bacterium]